MQRSAEYTVLGVGKVVNCMVQGPNNCVPVYVASIESIAAGILTLGQVVFWPLNLLAVYRLPSVPSLPADRSSDEEPDKTHQNIVSDIPSGSQEDRRLNYGLQVIQLGVMLMQLYDTEKEGDGDRSLINWKMLMLYFRCRPRGMKYAYEAMRFITNVKALYPKKTAHRILYGQFVNPRGGDRNNYANDLKMEHSIQDHKVCLRGMRGNKTLKAVQRCSSSSYGQKEFCIQFDAQSKIPLDSTRHTHACTTEDVKAMLAIVNEAKTFEYELGRKLHCFPNISKSPLDKLDAALLHRWLTNNKGKLFAGVNDSEETADDEDDDQHDEVQNSEEDLDM